MDTNIPAIVLQVLRIPVARLNGGGMTIVDGQGGIDASVLMRKIGSNKGSPG